MEFNWKAESLLITGASSGLGKALALAGVGLGANVILIGRNEKKLTDVQKKIERLGGRSHIFAFDLNETDKISALYRHIAGSMKAPPTVLINNVGYQVAGFVQNTPIDVYEKNYRVNVLAPIALIQNALPDMIKQKRGTIVSIMSSVMYRSFPGVSSYCASKSALGAIHESLKSELVGLPIKTLYVRPCGFRSDYWKNTDYGNRLGDFKFNPVQSKDPADLAVAILKAIEQGKEDVDLGSIVDRVACHLNYWFPKLVDKMIAKRNSKLINNRPI